MSKLTYKTLPVGAMFGNWGEGNPYKLGKDYEIWVGIEGFITEVTGWSEYEVPKSDLALLRIIPPQLFL